MLFRTQTHFALLMSALVLASVGCEPKSQPQPADDAMPQENTSFRDVQEKVQEATETTNQFASEQIRQYAEKMDQNLNQIDRKIATLKEQGQDLAGQAQASWNEQLKSLEKQRSQFRKKLGELRSASQGAWSDLKDGIDDAWVELKAASEEASTHFESNQ